MTELLRWLFVVLELTLLAIMVRRGRYPVFRCYLAVSALANALHNPWDERAFLVWQIPLTLAHLAVAGECAYMMAAPDREEWHSPMVLALFVAVLVGTLKDPYISPLELWVEVSACCWGMGCIALVGLLLGQLPNHSGSSGEGGDYDGVEDIFTFRRPA